MNTIITGSCTAQRPSDLVDAIAAADLIGVDITAVMTGNAIGADQLAKQWAESNAIKAVVWQANRTKHGDSCYLARDDDMLDVADAVIILWHHNDVRHLPHLADGATKRGIPLVVWKI